MSFQLPHNIAIFLDGTWNESDADHVDSSASKHTNVFRLFAACCDDPVQHCYYIPGVGTDIRRGGCAAVRIAAGLPEQPRWLERLRGGVLGYGLTERILEAYGIICQHYRPERNDRLYIFGFSRGAFAARSLVNFIDRVGILFDASREKAFGTKQELGKPDFLQHVRDAYRLFENDMSPEGSALNDLLQKIFGNSLLSASARESWQVRTHFLGLWDTVATRGCPARQQDFSAPRTEDLKYAVPATVMCARHALAAHEFRALFEPLMLWESVSSPRNALQRWFPGSHSDVGGGYPAKEGGLAVAPLRWIAVEASGRCLRLNFDQLPSHANVSLFQLHQEGDEPSIMAVLNRFVTGGRKPTMTELVQVHARRRVRAPLLQMAARRKCSRQQIDLEPGDRLILARADQCSDSARLHVQTPEAQRHASWTLERSDIQNKIVCADRCLFRLIPGEALHDYLFDRGLSKERSALARLTTLHLEEIRNQLATGTYINDLNDKNGAADFPLFARLTMLEQANLAAIVAWIYFDLDVIKAQLDRLEENVAATPLPSTHAMTLAIVLNSRWRNLSIASELNDWWTSDSSTLECFLDKLAKIQKLELSKSA